MQRFNTRASTFKHTNLLPCPAYSHFRIGSDEPCQTFSMPRINWSHALSDPAGTIKIVILVSWRTASVVLQRIASPCVSNTLSFRNAIARIWIGTTFAINGNILYSEPSNHHTQKVERAGFQTFILPTTSPDAMKNADTILVWCHGGGGMIGHPLQYQATYKRWIHKAGQRGKNIVILGLRYRKSPDRYAYLSGLPVHCHHIVAGHDLQIHAHLTSYSSVAGQKVACTTRCHTGAL